jgi:hypothetical protein
MTERRGYTPKTSLTPSEKVKVAYFYLIRGVAHSPTCSRSIPAEWPTGAGGPTQPRLGAKPHRSCSETGLSGRLRRTDHRRLMIRSGPSAQGSPPMPKLHHNTLAELESAVRAAVLDVRARLTECEDLPNFELTITASGRVHEGTIEVSYNLEGRYNDVVKGGRLTPVLDEFSRRHGWQRANAPLCLGGPETE